MVEWGDFLLCRVVLELAFKAFLYRACKLSTITDETSGIE
jgi:hypothetical protein